MARFNLTLLATAGVLLLSACIDPTGTVQFGQVTGTVLTAPTCPVERAGEECSPRPVSGASVIALDGDAIRGSTFTDKTGTFILTLPHGPYVIKATNVGGYASTATEDVLISNDPVRITLIVDSGIR